MLIVESEDIKNIKLPISDICCFNRYIVVATYENTMKIIKETQVVKEIKLPLSLTKICAFDDELLLGISFTEGILVILNTAFEIVDTIPGLRNAHMLSSSDGKVFVGTTDNTIMILQRNKARDSSHMFDLISVKKTSKTLTAIYSDKTGTALAFENSLVLLDSNMREIYSKEFTSNINSMCFSGESLVVGTIGGRIHYENIRDFEESFVFNSHAKSQNTVKVNFPVTGVYLDATPDEAQNENGQKHSELISAGYDGRLARWDLASRRLIDSIENLGERFIRKIVVENGKAYCLIENHERDSTGNILKLVDTKTVKCQN